MRERNPFSYFLLLFGLVLIFFGIIPVSQSLGLYNLGFAYGLLIIIVGLLLIIIGYAIYQNSEYFKQLCLIRNEFGFNIYIIFRLSAAIILSIVGIHLMDIGLYTMNNSSNIEFVSCICNETIIECSGYCPDIYSIGLNSGAIGLAFSAIAISLFLSVYSDLSTRTLLINTEQIKTDNEEIKTDIKEINRILKELRER